MQQKSTLWVMEMASGGLALVGSSALFVTMYFALPGYLNAVQTHAGLWSIRNDLVVVAGGAVVCEVCFIVKARIDRLAAWRDQGDAHTNEQQPMLDRQGVLVQVAPQDVSPSADESVSVQPARVTSLSAKVPGSRYERKYSWAESGMLIKNGTADTQRSPCPIGATGRTAYAASTSPATVLKPRPASRVPPYWTDLTKIVMERDNYRCGNCGREADLIVHHIIPLSLGGSNELGNLRTLCRSCHAKLHPHMRGE